MKINKPETWDENIPSPVNAVDLAKFQKSLDEIVGVQPDGTKRWRIVWGMDGDASVEWDRYQGRWMPRYRYKSYLTDPVANPVTGVLERRTDYIGIPRYFIEALIPRYRHDHETERAGVDSMKVVDPDTNEVIELDGQVYTERRVAGADYVTMMAVCQHNLKVEKSGWRPCCLKQARQGFACYGYYRLFDQVDIDQFAADYEARAKSRLCSPDQRPTDRDKVFLYQYWLNDQLREANRIDQELDDRRRARLKTILPLMRRNEHGSKKNRFSIPGL